MKAGDSESGLITLADGTELRATAISIVEGKIEAAISLTVDDIIQIEWDQP